jgi:hypothetical protein
LLKTKPFEEIKISEICAKALINRSTFYDHFNDKNELLEAMMYDMKDEFEVLKKGDKKPTNKKEYYKILLKNILDHMEKKKDIYSSIAKMNNNSFAKNMMIKYIVDNTTKDMEALFEEKISEQTKKIILFYISGFVYVLYEELKTPNTFNKEDIYNAMVHLMPNKKST